MTLPKEVALIWVPTEEAADLLQASETLENAAVAAFENDDAEQTEEREESQAESETEETGESETEETAD